MTADALLSAEAGVTADDIVRAWKDVDHRDEQGLPAHPAGEIELVAEPLAGGIGTIGVATALTCRADFSCIDFCVPTLPASTCDASSYGCC